MAQKLSIYDLNNSYYLYEDIENIISRIGYLYEIDFQKDNIKFTSKVKFSENVSLISEEATNVFNESVPVIKSLVRDIYAIIENVFVAKYGKFNKLKVEKSYIYLKELREFNNKLKHHNDKNVIFNLVSIINVYDKTFDYMIQYKYENEEKISIMNLFDFFQLYFVIMEAEMIIEIDRK